MVLKSAVQQYFTRDRILSFVCLFLICFNRCSGCKCFCLFVSHMDELYHAFIVPITRIVYPTGSLTLHTWERKPNGSLWGRGWKEVCLTSHHVMDGISVLRFLWGSLKGGGLFSQLQRLRILFIFVSLSPYPHLLSLLTLQVLYICVDIYNLFFSIYVRLCVCMRHIYKQKYCPVFIIFICISTWTVWLYIYAHIHLVIGRKAPYSMDFYFLPWL